MKFLSRVVWSEGMYLSPLHFQTQSRYFEDSMAFLAASLWREPWGLLHAELDPKAMRNGTAVLLHASGIFPDGLPFEVPNSDPPTEVRNLLDVFPSTDAVLPLYLAVPGRRDSGFDCDLGSSSNGSRFSRMQRTLRDETNGIDEREVDLGQKNIRLLTEAELTPEMLSLPIARVLRDGRGHLVCDEDFIPPCLRISASETLMLVVRRLVDAMGEKSATVSRGARRQGRFEAGTGALDVANYWFLHSLCSTLPALRHHLQDRRSHPEEVYRDLARLAGSLSTFALESAQDQIPPYRHLDLTTTFRDLDILIRRYLEVVAPSNTITLQFRKADNYVYAADVKDERCLRRARWIFGIRSSVTESVLLRQTPRLVKVCSAEGVGKLVQRALPGLELMHVPVPPAALHSQADMHYFSVSLSGACWQHILQTKQVGVYLPGDLGDATFDLTIIMETSE